jgi:type I restriction enzyme, S subunit
MSDWKTVPLASLVENLDSRRVPVKRSERQSGVYPYYGASGIVDWVGSYLFDGEHLLVAEDGENLNSRNVPIAFRATGKFWVNNHAHILKGPTHLLRYLEHFLNNLDVAGWVTGSAQPKLTQGNLNSIPINLPTDDDELKAIARVLGALDDRIELNRRMNRTLEELAAAVFRSWFVDFDPVVAKAAGRKPAHLRPELAALFPAHWQDSPLGSIPHGWRVARLADLCTTQYGYTTSATDEPIGPKFLRVMDINKQNWVEWGSVPHCVVPPTDKDKYALHVGDLVVARMADPGKSAIIEEEVDAVFASYLVRLKTRSLRDAYYLYGFLKSDLYLDYAESVKTGSVQLNMNANVIVGVDVVLPPEDILSAFLDFVLPLRKQIIHNVRESRTLAALRDTLLPKLLSGELRVKPVSASMEANT